MTGALTAVAWTVAATTAKKSSGISPIIIIYAVIAAGFYFLYYRPRKRKAQAAREQVAAWEVGDEVLTAGGIVGYIIDIDGDRVTLETSVGASFVVLKQYVLRKIEPVVPVDDDLDDDLEHDDDDEPEHDEHDDEVDDEVDDEHDDEADHHEPTTTSRTTMRPTTTRSMTKRPTMTKREATTPSPLPEPATGAPAGGDYGPRPPRSTTRVAMMPRPSSDRS
jgi:preprotein translocase subunit YajC